MPPKVICAWLFSIAVMFACCLAGCGDDKKAGGDDTTPGGQVCPDAIDGEAVWTYDGDDEQCTELAAALTAQSDDDDPSEAEQECAKMLTAFALVADGSECHADLAAACDTRTLQITCDVESNGAAECTATIRAPELDPGPCVLGLVIA